MSLSGAGRANEVTTRGSEHQLALGFVDTIRVLADILNDKFPGHASPDARPKCLTILCIADTGRRLLSDDAVHSPSHAQLNYSHHSNEDKRKLFSKPG